jgi:HEAT repeat protein
MKSLSLGSARTLLLAALALAAAVMVGSVIFMTVRDDGPVHSRTGAGGEDIDDPSGAPRPGAGGTHKKRDGATSPDDDENDDEGGIVQIGPGGQVIGTRDPIGEEFTVTADTLRAALEARHWEEIRRMIEVLQADQKPVPDDVVKALIAMLAKDDLALDAVLALGGVKDDATGRALAELASSNEASPEARQAALDALAKNGSKVALPFVQQLVAGEGLDPAIARHAYLALAGIGGREAAATLLDALHKHIDDDLRGVIVAALGTAKDSDEPMAAAARAAREKADTEGIRAMLTAAQILGPAAGPELKAELLRTIDNPDALSAYTDEADRQYVQAMAMPPAVAAGIIEPVLRHATTTGRLRDSALNALLQARGDAAAQQIAAALARTSDPNVRRQLADALGETRSSAATATLVALLDDENADVRRAAARGLSQIRDPAAVKPLLAHLPKSPPDADFARNIVTALGTIGANESLAALEKLAASEEAFWRDLRPFVQNAIVRIKTGNPESALLSTTDPKK